MNTALTSPSTDLEVVDPLTKAEREEFERAEVAIGKGFKYAAALGEALSVVSEKRLYRENYPTFEDYCRDRWGVEVRKAYRLIDLSAIREDVSNWSHELAPPERESVARELKKLPAEDRGEAWAKLPKDSAPSRPRPSKRSRSTATATRRPSGMSRSVAERWVASSTSTR